MNDVLGFYLDCKSIKEKHGHTFYDFMRNSYEEMEQCHTFIQMAFPLKEKSTMVIDAPVIDDETIAIFRDSSILRERLGDAYFHMMSFLGLHYTGGKYSALRVCDWPWLKLNDHNYLRLTRMILSLKLLGREDLSHDLYNRLKLLYYIRWDEIGPVTFKYWTEAAQ